jgi:hypothetical protein
LPAISQEVTTVIAQIVRFKSRLSDERVLETYRARAPRYQALPGLIQKYYLKFSETGEHGAVYLWASEKALGEFRGFELAHSIPDAYQVVGVPEVQIASLVMKLRSESWGVGQALPDGSRHPIRGASPEAGLAK